MWSLKTWGVSVQMRTPLGYVFLLSPTVTALTSLASFGKTKLPINNLKLHNLYETVAAIIKERQVNRDGGVFSKGKVCVKFK